jgi:preprotein translocase subunit SecG
MLYNVLLIVLIVVSVAMIVLILMQQGKGADAGAAFGSGASGTVFGSQGSANVLLGGIGISVSCIRSYH